MMISSHQPHGHVTHLLTDCSSFNTANTTVLILLIMMVGDDDDDVKGN